MVKIKIISFLIPFLILFVLINKPIYSVIFLILFIYEYFFILLYISLIYINKYKYYSIEISEKDISNMLTIEIWIECCKINAFKKLYYILNKKKKITLINLIKIIIILTFSIPIKFLQTIYNIFYKNNRKTIKNKFIYYYHNILYETKNKKIEIMNQKIYLNMKTIKYTLGEFIKNIKFEPNAVIKQKKDVSDFIKELREPSFKILKNNEYNKELFTFQKATFYDHKDQIIQKGHFFHKSGKTFLHHTSSTNFNKLDNQKIDKNIPTLTKPKSIKPGTVLSDKISKIKYIDEIKEVPKYEVDSILFNNKNEFDLEIDELTRKFNEEIKSEVYLIMKKNGISTNNTLFMEIMSGTYAKEILEVSDEEVDKIVHNFFHKICE